ncbi:MAG: N-acetylmuramoyl-L-alanine amidase [Defluviitaleaceae bacterium]|nr:N-acetylmuramoyl-L-alanine amidase [Defluviitaleaceae bacterium]
MPRIAVFAGHGGSDPGAVAQGRQEKDLTLAVSNAVTQILRGWGYSVINNRTTDVDRSITRDANLANENRADALVEIHFNSNHGTPGTGSEVFYSIRDTGRGRALAGAILNRIVALGFANRGVKTQVNAQGQDAFGILRLANMPAVLVECAFINNPADMARLNINSMAMAIAEGIRDIFPIGGGGTVGGMPPYPGTAIRQGERSESVRQIQACLNRVSARHPSIQRLTEDGIFGPRTLDAVMTFQRIMGLTPDGVVGPLTWGRLAQECPASGGGTMPTFPGTLLRVGSRGDNVRQVQHCLNRVSQPVNSQLSEDGVFGPLTQAGVINFQRLFGLNPDGIVGPITWGRLAQECNSAVAVFAQEGCGCSDSTEVAHILGLPNYESMDTQQMLLFLLLTMAMEG